MATGTITPAAASSERSTRLWEVDAARGIAVLAMICFHLMWDLRQFFGLTDIDVFSPPCQVFARTIGSTFMFVLGMSLTLDAYKYERDGRMLWRRNVMRGSNVFGAGMLVTLATYIVVGEQFVRFGILHLAGASIILATPFVRRSARVAALAGVAVLALGIVLQGVVVPFPWLIPFGVREIGVEMVDYYPLLPWFGVVLIGVAFGKYAYPNKQRRFMLPDVGSAPLVRLLQLVGRHSLAIYLLHQPGLIALIFALSQVRMLS